MMPSVRPHGTRPQPIGGARSERQVCTAVGECDGGPGMGAQAGCTWACVCRRQSRTCRGGQGHCSTTCQGQKAGLQAQTHSIMDKHIQVICVPLYVSAKHTPPLAWCPGHNLPVPAVPPSWCSAQQHQLAGRRKGVPRDEDVAARTQMWVELAAANEQQHGAEQDLGIGERGPGYAHRQCEQTSPAAGAGGPTRCTTPMCANATRANLCLFPTQGKGCCSPLPTMAR